MVGVQHDGGVALDREGDARLVGIRPQGAVEREGASGISPDVVAAAVVVKDRAVDDKVAVDGIQLDAGRTKLSTREIHCHRLGVTAVVLDARREADPPCR